MSSYRRRRGDPAAASDRAATERVREMRRHAAEFPSARVVLATRSAGWALKVPFVRQVLGPSLRWVQVVRDPRAWVHLMLHAGKPSLYDTHHIHRRLAAAFKARTGVRLQISFIIIV